MFPVETPFKVYTGSDGKPLDRGYVYFGIANQNPVTSPVTVYWDAAGTQPAAQPLRTVNGYIVRAGTPANVFVSGAYSELVNDRKGRQVFYARTSDDFSVISIVINFILSLAAAGGSALIGFIQAAANAVARTVQDKLRERTSVFDFLSAAERNDVTTRARAIDLTAKLQIAINSGISLDWPAGDYRCDTKLAFNQANVVYTADDATLVFNGTSATRLADITANNVMFKGMTFTANSKQPMSALVYVATNVIRPRFHDCVFKDIVGTLVGTNVLNQTYALLISPYGVLDFDVLDCQFKNLIKYNNGAYSPVAIGSGFVGGICFLEDTMTVPVAAQPTPSRGSISLCVFDTIQTVLAGGLTDAEVAVYDDADAIRSYGQPGGAERLDVIVAECTFINCSKRACKLLASRAEISDCRVFADGLTYGMVNPFYIGNNCSILGAKIYASTTKPVQIAVQWIVNGETTQRQTLVQDVYVSHCVTGIGFGALSGADSLTSFTARDIYINQASIYGLIQTAPQPVSQTNLTFENISIYGSGNNCTGILVGGAVDGTSGCSMKNIVVGNASINIGGVNNQVEGLRQEISSNTFAGPSAGARLFRIGQGGAGGFQNLSNIFINAFGLNTGFLSAARPELILIIGDNANYKNIRIKVPDGLSQTYPHYETYGNDWALDGFTYDGPGICYIGQTLASVRWTVKNAKRLGNGASASSFFYTGNAGTGNGQFENITDFRPTTASSITINAGLGAGNRFVVYNVASKTSNGTIVFNGGLATVANANYFP